MKTPMATVFVTFPSKTTHTFKNHSKNLLYMSLLKLIKERFEVLADPKSAAKALEKSTFDEDLSSYLKLLLLTGVLTSVFMLIWSILTSTYYDLILNADVDYFRMLNYAMGRATSIVFLYFFSGTFGLFILSALINPFTKVKYFKMLQAMFFAVSPFFIFGWIPFLIPSLGVWSLFLLVVGLKSLSKTKTDKKSINQRD